MTTDKDSMINRQRPRGRPSLIEDPNATRADEVIAWTVYRLLMMGFALRSRNSTPGVAEVVAKEALVMLKRADSYGKALGPDRIEQIFESWFKREQKRRCNAKEWPLRARWRYSKGSLKERVPSKVMPIEQLAARLLKNGGSWPDKSPVVHGDLILSPKARKELGPMPKIKSGGEV